MVICRIVDIGDAGVDHLAEIVRRDVGRHADRDAAAAIDQQVREPRRKNLRLLDRLVVVGLEIDGVLVDVVEQRLGDSREARLGVTLRRRRVAVHRAEIALPVDQRQAHREILRHADHRVVDRLVAMGMVLTHDLADDACRFAIGAVPVVAAVLHRVEDAPMDRLQPVAHVGKRPRHDHAHGVIEVGALHLLFDADRRNVEGRWRGRRRSVGWRGQIYALRRLNSAANKGNAGLSGQRFLPGNNLEHFASANNRCDRIGELQLSVSCGPSARGGAPG